MNILGCKKGKASRLAKQIREKHKKPPGSYIPIEEFCEFTGLKEERIKPFLKA